jgi:hypothetical protein
VSTDVPAGLTARLDRRRFDVMLANLIGNALRHGGPLVTVTARIQSGGELALEVRDHGHGLPPAAIPHIFDRFYKADTARARSGGSGLGLAIAWENACLHGGHIHAGNHPDGGAVFTVSLPLTSQDHDDAQAAYAEHARDIAAPTTASAVDHWMRCSVAFTVHRQSRLGRIRRSASVGLLVQSPLGHILSGVDLRLHDPTSCERLQSRRSRTWGFKSLSECSD